MTFQAYPITQSGFPAQKDRQTQVETGSSVVMFEIWSVANLRKIANDYECMQNPRHSPSRDMNLGDAGSQTRNLDV